MKYLFFIVLLAAVLITAGCTEQLGYRGTINDNNYAKFLKNATLAKDNAQLGNDVNNDQYDAAVLDAQKLVQDYQDSPVPDDANLTQARNLYIAGYTQIAQGDIEGGLYTCGDGAKLTNDWTGANKLRS